MIKRLTRIEPEPPWSFLSAIGAIIAMFAALVMGSTLTQLFIADDTASALIAGWSIGMLLTILFIRFTRLRTVEDEKALRLGGTDTPLPIVFLLVLGIAIALDLLSQAVTGEFELTTAELDALRGVDVTFIGWVIALVFMVLLQPIAEEMIFRGVLFPVLRFGTGAWTGLLLCAGLSGVFHFASYPPPTDTQLNLLWYGLILPLLDGLVITTVRAYTGSTRAAIIAHAAIGLFAILKMLVVLG